MSHKPGSSTTEMRAWLHTAHRQLCEHADVLDNLNVFPVADADTGANLSVTVGFAAEAARLIEGRDVGELLAYAGQAALEEARGNSGMLAALVLAAMGAALEGSARLTAEQLREAFVAAQVRCSSALTEPVPGTMLSVLQAAGETPVPDSAPEGSNQQLVQWLDAMLAACTRAVVHTVSQLPVLTARGTVDSGALGMLVLLSALRAELGGTEEYTDPVPELIRHHTHPLRATPEEDRDGYEVMGTMDLSALDAAELRHQLDNAGDSVIVSAVGEHGEGYTWRVHVHVTDPEVALDLMRDRGSARNVTVTTLTAEPR
ncbi:DAK2 domain-containing protein [Kocuria sp.]|uniref:DAK2 domain-containing protein n=1 Tax=Kocuria sp. TaxID=1871328 RepID=UPI0026DBF1E9|nr:DAK2 domain-containing protein [Kocuria sp.]MDO4918518.1 DAK2 domain-containing protein [Kocuria sp.]